MAQKPLFTITRRYIPEIPGAGRLGRHYRADSRSAAYPYVRTPGRVPAAVEHTRHIPILDQGNVGSCTGNAQTGALGSDPLYGSLKPGVQATLGEQLALALYSAAEDIDGDGPYPPQDNGSSGMSVCQAALKAGLISGYTHVTGGLDALIDALQDSPVIVGTSWYSTMDDPDGDGFVTIGPGAYVRGGHEYVVRGVDPAAQAFLADNSWGTGWGDGGSFRLSFDTMGRLLSEEGDATVSVPLTEPAPVPHPSPPQPAPVPAVYAADLDYVRLADPWAAQHHTGQNAQAVHHYQQWKAARGIS